MTLFRLLLLEMVTQGTFKKHKTESALQISCMSQTRRITVLIPSVPKTVHKLEVKNL